MAETLDVPVTKCDAPLERLKYLHDTKMLSFRKIALLAEFAPIPAGTLCAIYNGKPIPKKWLQHFKPRKPRLVWVRVMGHQSHERVMQ